MDPDDPQIQYILSSWTRIGAVLGNDFIPYLPVVMPSLLRSATLKPDVAVIGEPFFLFLAFLHMETREREFRKSQQPQPQQQPQQQQQGEGEEDAYDPADGWQMLHLEDQVSPSSSSPFRWMLMLCK